VLSDSVKKTAEESPLCNANSLSKGQCQLDNSFIVPLEDSFTESTEVESLKRNIRSSDSSPDASEYIQVLNIACSYNDALSHRQVFVTLL